MTNVIAKFGIALILATSICAEAADSKVEILTCNGRRFYGANVVPSRDAGYWATYTPVEVSGSNCRIHPRTRLSVNTDNCLNFSQRHSNLLLGD